MRALSRWLLLGATILAIDGCGRAPPPSAAGTAAPASTTAANTPDLSLPTPASLANEPAPEPVNLSRPAGEPLLPASAIPRKRIAAALRQARRALDAGQLDERDDVRDVDGQDASSSSSSPSPSSSSSTSSLPAVASDADSASDALALYRGVLATDPKNAAALQGMEAVIAALHARAQKALARGNVVDAQRDADRIALLRADDPRLAAMHEPLANGWKAAGLIERGRRLESVGSLIAPRSANAAAAYRHALAIDPASTAARAGLDRIEAVFTTRALVEANAAHYPRAEQLLAQAAHVRGGSPGLTDAQARVLAIRQKHALLLKSEVDAALDAGDPDRAAALLTRIEVAMPRSPLAAEVRRRIANARLYGRYLPSQVFSDALASGGRSPDMVVIPVGSFTMGSPDDENGHEADESPQRTIAFAHGFAMARTEVTVEQFGRFVKATHYRSDAERSGHSMIYDEAQGKLVARDGVSWRDDHLGKPAAAQLPVLHVSWNDAQAYTIWLSSQTAHLYRLPSEAEFEYALRAGGAGAWPWTGSKPPRAVGNLAGSDPSPGGRRWGDAFANYADGYWGPAPVARFAASAFGLYDMVGNVSEWTQDCWHDGYRRAPQDASAWVNPGCAQRVVRGASWASAPAQARSAWRTHANADEGSSRLGFRVVREL